MRRLLTEVGAAMVSVLGVLRAARSDQDRSGRALRLVLVHDAETARHLLIGLDQPAHVTAETVLVELVLGGDIPQAAGVR